ncbi:MAG: PAS domain-containing sensor histidine kinase [Hydrogenibacillus sp.]|nr:PAS domain-containing sensor histidine kinase [Hydrogenibacillus sp.]
MFVQRLPIPSAVLDGSGRFLLKNDAYTTAVESQSFTSDGVSIAREAGAQDYATIESRVQSVGGMSVPLAFADTYLVVFPGKFPPYQVYLEEAFKRFQSALLLIDAAGTILNANTAFGEWFQITDRAVGQNVHEVFKDLPDEQAPVPERLIDGFEVRDEPFIWMRDGKALHLTRDSYVLGGPGGARLIAFKEVGRYVNIDEKVLRADRLATIGQMAAGTAHEIRNPLTSLRGFLQLLQMSLAERQMDKEYGYVQLMLKEITRINALVDQFLLLGKPRDIRFQKIRLPQVVGEIVPVLESEAMLHDIVIHNDVREPLPLVIGDSELVKQVIINIVKNAIEAIEQDGTITLSASVDPGSQVLILDIHDTGPGIPPYMIDRIFDPFFTTKSDGTGLGLSVCQRIVQDLGGQIRVLCKGYGTNVQILLPYVRDEGDVVQSD